MEVGRRDHAQKREDKSATWVSTIAVAKLRRGMGKEKIGTGDYMDERVKDEHESTM